MNHRIDSRSVRVFLSSTFRDFGEERDLLVRRVFPALRARLKDRFVELVDVDLRWGITVEQAERGEVLPICLAEIDRSRPYFIGLLGERYGWVPPKEAYPPDLVRQRRWLKAHQGGKSVTELEVLHGVLNDPKMAGRARFYVRSAAYAKRKGRAYLPQDAEERRRQRALRRCVAASGFPVIRYATPKDLAKRLEGDLWRLLDELFPADQVPDAFERDRLRHEAYAAPRRRLYLGGEGYTQRLLTLLKDEQRILITGQSGGGKSALLANALAGFRRKHPRIPLLEHYLGASADAAEAVALVRRIIEFIRRTTGSSDPAAADPKDLLESLPTWLGIANAWGQKHRTRFVFVLDALNNLTTHRDLRWLPSFLPERVQVVISCLEGDIKAAVEGKGSWRQIAIEPLSVEGREQLLRRYLERYNKTLPEDLARQALLHPLARNPLWLKTLAEELRLFGSHEELAARLATLLGAPAGKALTEPPTVDDLFEHVLSRIEEDHGKRLVRAAMSAIWASRAGLSEPEILNITGATPAAWASIRHALDEMLLETGGRIVFGHDYAKVAVKDRYLTTETLQRKAHRGLAQHFTGTKIDARMVEELPYQLQSAEAWRDLERALTGSSMFLKMVSSRGELELLGYWNALDGAGKGSPPSAYGRAWSRWLRQDTLGRLAVLSRALFLFLYRWGDHSAFTLNIGRYSIDVARQSRLGNREVAFRMGDLGLMLQAANRLEESMSISMQALELLGQSGSASEVDLAAQASNVARVLHAMGSIDAAVSEFRRSLALMGRALKAASDERLATLLNNLAMALHDQGSLVEARSNYQAAIAMVEELNGGTGPLLGVFLKNFGCLAQDEGSNEEALKMFERSTAVLAESVGPAHVETAYAESRMGICLYRLGSYEKAVGHFQRAFEAISRRFAPDHPECISAAENLSAARQKSNPSAVTREAL